MALYPQNRNESFFELLSHLDPECQVDNTVLNSGSGGDTIASDDIGGVKHQRVKLSVGADGSASDAVPVSNGMDVTGAAVQAVGIVGQFDDAATGAVTENQFAPVRISTRRALLVEGVASGTAVPISAASLPLPSSAATEASLAALAGDVGDTADAAATAGSTGTLHAKQRLMTSQLDAIQTAVQTLDNAIAGTEMQVDVVAALPAGTNNIGDVDVLSTVNSASRTASGALGALNNAVTVNAEGAGTIHWEIDTGTLAGTVSVEATLDDANWFAVNVIENDGTISSSFTAFGKRGVYVTGGYSQVRLRVSAYTSGTSNARLEASQCSNIVRLGQALPTGANAIGKLAANSGVDIGDVDILSIAAGDNNIGNVDVMTVNGVAPAFGSGIRGATVQRVTIATDDIVPASQSGTWTVQPGNTANTTAWLMDARGPAAVDAAVTGNPVQVAGRASTAIPTAMSADGDIQLPWLDLNGAMRVAGRELHDGPATGAPVRVGVKAETAISGITLVADGDATDLHAGVDGVLIVREHCNLEDVVQERTTNTDGASTAFASGLAAPGAGVRLWITSVDLCNSSATFITVDLRDGSAGAVLWTLPVPATGGVVKTFNPPLKLTANTALAFDASAATTTLTISANGFKSKV